MIPTLLALVAAQTAAPPVAPAPPATAASAPAPAADPRLRTCLDLVRTAPQRAVETATAWQGENGGLPARQCLGLAYVELEMWASAATVYEQAAQEAERLQDARRTDFLVQAGNAWLAVEEATNAVRVFDAALAATALTDELRGEIHLDRARARVALDNLPGAREDLDRAIQLVPADAFAWYMSAALARRENELARARTDIERAMQLAPDNLEIALLGGTLAGLAGNMAEAERLYRRVAEGAPESEAGRAARASLATLREIEVPAPATTTSPPAPAAATPATTAPASPAPQPD